MRGVGDIPGKGKSLGEGINDHKNTGHLGKCEQFELREEDMMRKARLPGVLDAPLRESL